MNKFNNYKFPEWILTTLSSKNISEPTDIQAKAFAIDEKLNKSLIITAKTGSGKTYCYLLPILKNLDLELNETQCVIILPTKELARQVYSKIIDFTTNQQKLKIKLLVANDQIKNKPHIVVGTPNKIYEFVMHQNTNKFIKYFVLDEADTLVDYGFNNQIMMIFNKINSPKLVKYALSATLHDSLANQLKNILGNAKVISTSASIWLNSNITHNIVYQNDNSNPINTLKKLVSVIHPYFCIIFANTKNKANNIYKEMGALNFNVGLIHQDLSQRERKNIFKDINEYKYQYLVATDLIARGVDLPFADIVISYGLPKESVWYIHRAGRVGRAKKTGSVYVIYQSNIDQQINSLSKKQIKWNFLLLNKNNELVNKNLKLKTNFVKSLDYSTNKEIQKVIYTGSKKVKPGYKKKIKEKIKKIKQKKRHEFIEKKIKQVLIAKNIRDSKKKTKK